MSRYLTSLTRLYIDASMNSYSIYEAKARFSELIRRVRRGGTIIVTYRGAPVAEIRPIEAGTPALETRLEDLERRGLLVRPPDTDSPDLRPVADRPGALRRFLEERAE